MKFYVFVTIFVSGLILFSCNNNEDNISEISISIEETKTRGVTSEQFGDIHNIILEELLKRTEANQISDFNDLIKQLMDISLNEIQKYDASYTFSSQDSVYINTVLKAYKDEVLNDKQRALDLLILVSDYPEETKDQMKEVIRDMPDIETFVNEMNNIESSLSLSRSSEFYQSFDIIKSVAMASNEFWGSKTQTRASFGTYLADGLGGAAASITGVGIICIGATTAAASFLWEKAIEPCYSNSAVSPNNNSGIIQKPSETLKVDSDAAGNLVLKPVQK